MQIPWQNIHGFSGATAVGAIVLVALLLMANTFATNLFPVIDMYASTPTWAIVVAIPLLSLSYLIGLLSIGVGESIIVWFHVIDVDALIEDPITVSSRKESVVGRYQQLRQEGEILSGSAIAFALLAIGTALSTWEIKGWRRFLTSMAIAALFFAAGSIGLSAIRHRAAHRLANSSGRNSMRCGLPYPPAARKTV